MYQLTNIFKKRNLFSFTCEINLYVPYMFVGNEWWEKKYILFNNVITDPWTLLEKIFKSILTVLAALSVDGYYAVQALVLEVLTRLWYELYSR